jgi:hypothetical protein
MGIEGNALDFYYDCGKNMPHILGEFASQCVTDAAANPKACPFASSSMKSLDPAMDILERINYITGNLTLQSYSAPNSLSTDGIYTFEQFKDETQYLLSFLSSWNIVAQNLLNLETIIQQESIQQSHRILKRSGININDNLTFSSFSHYNELFGAYNVLTPPAVFCQDSSFNNIDNVEEFGLYRALGYRDRNLLGLAEPYRL